MHHTINDGTPRGRIMSNSEQLWVLRFFLVFLLAFISERKGLIFRVVGLALGIHLLVCTGIVKRAPSHPERKPVIRIRLDRVESLVNWRGETWKQLENIQGWHLRKPHQNRTRKNEDVTLEVRAMASSVKLRAAGRNLFCPRLDSESWMQRVREGEMRGGAYSLEGHPDPANCCSHPPRNLVSSQRNTVASIQKYFKKKEEK